MYRDYSQWRGHTRLRGWEDFEQHGAANWRAINEFLEPYEDFFIYGEDTPKLNKTDVEDYVNDRGMYKSDIAQKLELSRINSLITKIIYNLDASVELDKEEQVKYLQGFITYQQREFLYMQDRWNGRSNPYDYPNRPWGARYFKIPDMLKAVLAKCINRWNKGKKYAAKWWPKIPDVGLYRLEDQRRPNGAEHISVLEFWNPVTFFRSYYWFNDNEEPNWNFH